MLFVVQSLLDILSFICDTADLKIKMYRTQYKNRKYFTIEIYLTTRCACLLYVIFTTNLIYSYIPNKDK